MRNDSTRYSEDSQNVREYRKFLLYFCYQIVNAVRSLFISVCVCMKNYLTWIQIFKIGFVIFLTTAA